jgi:3-hydroxyacyl-CoA dehydrogenase
VADVDLVIEAVIEKLELKLEIFGQLDKLCKPEAILASKLEHLLPFPVQRDHRAP